MIAETAGRHRLLIMDSIDELPVKRFYKHNRYALIDSNIGSDLNDISTHIAKIRSFMHMKDLQSAHTQLSNMEQALYLICSEKNVKHLSLMPLIVEVDGKSTSYASDLDFENLLKKLNDVPVGWFNRVINYVKKNLMQN